MAKMSEHTAPALPTARPLMVVILGAGAVLALAMGIRQAFGLYLDPLSQSLGLGREVFAFALGFLNLLYGLAAPFAGAIADRYGAGRVVVAGTVLYIAGVALMASAASGTGLIAGCTLVGLGISGTGFTAVLGAVARAAPPERRGTALGLASMGGSIGQFLALPYAQGLIAGLGWTGSLFALAATAAIMAPLGLAIAGRPAPDTSASAQTYGAALAEAIRHRGFLLLTAGFFVCGFHIGFIAVHLPAFLADRSFAPWLGAAALTVIGFTNIIGTFAWGRTGEIIEKRLALTTLYVARSIVLVGFVALPLTQTTVLILCTLLGFLWLGTIPLTSGLVATLFGPRWMSMLFGVVFLSHQTGAFTGAWLGGHLYDAFHSYQTMWWISIGLGLIAACLHMPIREAPVVRPAV